MRFAVIPTMLAGAMLVGLTGCAGQPTAPVTVTVTPTATASAAVTDQPNDQSSPDELAISMFRDIMNKDATKYTALLDSQSKKEYAADLVRTAALVDVSKYSDFQVTNVTPGWGGNDETTDAHVYYTVMHAGEQLRGEIHAELNDPNYAPNTWTLNYQTTPAYNNMVYTTNDGVHNIDVTLSGNGKKILLPASDDDANVMLFPGDYTVTGTLDHGHNMTKQAQTFTFGAITRP